MMRRRYLLAGAVSVLVGVIAWVLLSISPDSWIAYVVCDDKRIYELDLIGGKILRVSAPLAGMDSGGEAQIAYADGIVYVSTQRGKQLDFYPLLAMDVKRDFEVIGVHRFGVPFDRDYWSSGQIGDVYSLTLSPSARRLFVFKSGAYKGPAFTSAWPAGKGLAEVVVSGAESAVMPWYEFSPDVNSVAVIRPAGQRIVEDESGNTTRRVWNGSVLTRDISGGPFEKKELIANRGLHPPWGLIEGPLVHWSGGNRIDLYDRDSGERIAKIDVFEISGLAGGYRTAMLKGTDLLVLAAIDPNDRFDHSIPSIRVIDGISVTYDSIDRSVQGYVLVLNVVTQQIISKIKVGPRPSNIAVAKRAGFLRTLVSKLERGPYPVQSKGLIDTSS